MDGVIYSSNSGPWSLTYHFHMQVHVISPENWMRLFVKNDNDVTWFNTRFLVSLWGKCDLLTIFHSFVDMHLQDFTFFDCLFTLTVLTTILFYRKNTLQWLLLICWMIYCVIVSYLRKKKNNDNNNNSTQRSKMTLQLYWHSWSIQIIIQCFNMIATFYK